MLRRTLPAVALVAFVTATSLWLWARSAPLSMIERGGSGPPTLVMLHGYGSRAEDWIQFEERWQLPSNMRRVFPQAPLRGPLSGQRGWWWLGLESYVKEEGQLADMTGASPGGIKVASRLVRDLLATEKQPVILGGFSQGAMTSAEIAFQTDQELAGLILLGGTTVNEEAWAEHFAGRRHLPIFIAHGRQDGVLSFAIMERFQARLKAAGLNVTWYPFDGGHGIPDEVVREISAWVSGLSGPQKAQKAQIEMHGLSSVPSAPSVAQSVAGEIDVLQGTMDRRARRRCGRGVCSGIGAGPAGTQGRRGDAAQTRRRRVGRLRA